MSSLARRSRADTNSPPTRLRRYGAQPSPETRLAGVPETIERDWTTRQIDDVVDVLAA
jgi:hypothetical protein